MRQLPWSRSGGWSSNRQDDAAGFLRCEFVGSDSHLQFMNWTTDNNGAWDYAADTRGYTVGGLAEYDDRTWSLRYGIFAMPVVANGIDLDWAFSRANGQNGEFELRHGWISQRKGVTRLLFYANHAHMGVYREAVQAFLTGTRSDPDNHRARAFWRTEIWHRLQHGTRVDCESERVWAIRLERGTARVVCLHRGGPNGGGRRGIFREIAGTGRKTRWRLRWSRMRSSGTTRIICGWAAWGFCSATAT